jgi:hypothetical protein
MLRSWPLWVAALWWGSLTTVGFWVVPLLFKHLPTPAMAGAMAAQLFTAQTWVGLVCGWLLLLAARGKQDADQPQALAEAAKSALLFIAAGMLLAALSEFAVAPRIVARENLKLWHAVGSGMYLLQWVCAGLTLMRLFKARS